MKASIIIPTYNKLSRLKLVLHSLELQTCKKNEYEIIVVNDGSSDETNEYLENTSFDMDLYYINQKNSGRSSARNQGIKSTKNEIIIFVDDDTVLSYDFIKTHLQMQQEGYRCIHGMIREIPYIKFFQDPTRGILYEQFNDMKVKELAKKCINLEDLEHNFYNKIHKMSKITAHEKIVQAVFDNDVNNWYWFTFSGGNMSVPKIWVEEVGVFDENYCVNWGCEDMDLGYRLMKKGYPFAYCCSAINYHLDHYRADFAKLHNNNLKLFYEKYGEQSFMIFQQFVEGSNKSKDVIEYLIDNSGSLK